MKLQQDQVWKRGEEYFRILHLERLEVEYKSRQSLTTREGTRHTSARRILPPAENRPPDALEEIQSPGITDAGRMACYPCEVMEA